MIARYPLDPDDPQTAAFVEQAICESLGAVPLEPARHDAVRDRLLARVRASRQAMHHAVHVPLEAGAWLPLLRGVRVKRLDDRNRCVLIELAPGASLPAHRHHVDEECVVLRGSAHVGEVRVEKGDFHLARSHSRHGVVRSETGALLMLHGAPIGHVGEVLRDLVTALLPGDDDPPITIRADEGVWTEAAPGVSTKWLRNDGQTQSKLVRIAPGARVAANSHEWIGERLMIEGETFVGDCLMRAGDYHVAGPASAPQPLHSDGGGLMYLRCAA